MQSTQFIVEDDGKEAYAYLLEDSDVIGDIWLYNQATTPLITNWTQKIKCGHPSYNEKWVPFIDLT